MKIIGLGVYLGIGALLHALFIGATFDWSSAWTWGVLFGWPVMMTAASFAALCALALMAVIAASAIEWNHDRVRRMSVSRKATGANP